MVEIKRHDNESALAALRRFTKRLQQAGILVEARKNQFRARLPSAYKRRKSAMFRLKRHKEYERLKKLGKLPERKGRPK
ncbi:MAG: 30S ribosomal protein S21 [Candidatus Niyogibacteria bacterium]|nr:30S ribosomal protein S21 [Candidatus Niyogibacteria bacterium]